MNRETHMTDISSPAIRKAIEKVQLDWALGHVPMIYAIAIVNLGLVVALCVHERLGLAVYGWMFVVGAAALVRMGIWIRRSRHKAEIADKERVLRSLTLVSVLGIAGLSVWTVYATVTGMLMNLTLIPISLVFGSTCIAHCIAPLRRAAVGSLLVGVLPSAIALWVVGDIEGRILAVSMVTIVILMVRFLLDSYKRILNGIFLEQKNLELAYSDALTGLANRRAIMSHIEEVEEISRVGGQGFALAVLDLDGFKQVNDTYGHHIGDALLQAVADRLAGAAQAHEYVGRVGGDEFVVVMPGIETEAAVSARVTAYLGSMVEPAAIDGTRFPLAGSIGYAIHPRDGATGEEVLLVADKALYAAKRKRKKTRSTTAQAAVA